MAYVMEYPGKYGLILYNTSILGSWNSHWYYPLVMTSIAMENPVNKWRFLAGKIIYKWAIFHKSMDWPSGKLTQTLAVIRVGRLVSIKKNAIFRVYVYLPEGKSYHISYIYAITAGSRNI